MTDSFPTNYAWFMWHQSKKQIDFQKNKTAFHQTLREILGQSLVPPEEYASWFAMETPFLRTLRRIATYGDPTEETMTLYCAHQRRGLDSIYTLLLIDGERTPNETGRLSERLEDVLDLHQFNSITTSMPEQGRVDTSYFGRNPTKYGLTPTLYKIERLLLPDAVKEQVRHLKQATLDLEF